jgi:hypothetical protein
MSALGHSLPLHSAPVPINVRYASDSDHSRAKFVCPLSANRSHAEEHAPICQSNIRNKNPDVLPGTFILNQALVI